MPSFGKILGAVCDHLVTHACTGENQVNAGSIEKERIFAEIIILGETPNSPNPGKASSLEIVNGQISGQ